MDSKNVEFLHFCPSNSPSINHNKLLVESPKEIAVQREKNEPAESINIKEEESDETDNSQENIAKDISDEESDDLADAQEVANNLTSPPETGRVLRDRTIQVKPVKYSHLNEGTPENFRSAVKGPDSKQWLHAINDELKSIEHHDVWLDHWDTPPKALQHTWVFRTKPATNSSPEKQKARLCIQGFMQTYGKDFFKTFAPTGKFPSLLALLILAINLIMPVRQFDVKSALLFAPLQEEIFIKTPEGSKRKAPYLKLV
jgi:hypothetical protein